MPGLCACQVRVVVKVVERHQVGAKLLEELIQGVHSPLHLRHLALVEVVLTGPICSPREDVGELKVQSLKLVLPQVWLRRETNLGASRGPCILGGLSFRRPPNKAILCETLKTNLHLSLLSQR